MSDINNITSILSDPRASQTEVQFSLPSNGPTPPRTDVVNSM